jgi:protoporphyrinogen oxidase
MSTYDFIIYGNSVGALISALELAKKHKVALVNPAPNWGAHFAGLKINNTSFDIGMNYFEFTTFHQQSNDLLSYNPDARNDSARFAHLIQKYFEEMGSIVEVPTPLCYFEGVFSKDIVITNELEILRQLPLPLRNKIRKELEDIVKGGKSELHTSNKKKNEALFLNTSYEEVSLANHGYTFHNTFIEPLCKKIFNISSKDIPALFHRVAWTPLFYPETLLDAFDHPEKQLAPTIFHYPGEGYFAKCIETLTERSQDNTNITIVREKTDRIAIDENYVFHFGDKQASAKHLVWCGDLPTLLAATGINSAVPEFRKASIALVFLTISKSLLVKEFSTLYVCDENEMIYRITNQDYSAQNNSDTVRMVFEFNNDLLAAKGITDDHGLIENVQKFLNTSGITEATMPSTQFAVKIFKNAVNLPVLSNFNTFTKLHATVREQLKDVELIGAAAGFVATSFNDQVVQAMKLGVKYN